MCEEKAYKMLTLPGASLTISQRDQGHIHGANDDLSVIEICGNRRGMASLGNILLWLYSNNEGREFLALTALPFLRTDGIMALSIRVNQEDGKGLLGRIRLLDKQCQFEWEVSEDDLPRLAVRFYRLASSKTPLHDHNPEADINALRPPGTVNGPFPLDSDAEIFAGCTGEW